MSDTPPPLAPARRAGSRTSSHVVWPALLALLAGCKTAPTTPSPAPPLPSAASAYPRPVPFVGINNVFGTFQPGDALIITAVHGPTDAIAIGSTYQIDGTYTLASHETAQLVAYETAGAPNQPHRQRVPGQSLAIGKGTGTFTLYLKVEDPGYPHVSLYPADGGESFGGEYFGTGDFVPPADWRTGPPAVAQR